MIDNDIKKRLCTPSHGMYRYRSMRRYVIILCDDITYVSGDDSISLFETISIQSWDDIMYTFCDDLISSSEMIDHDLKKRLCKPPQGTDWYRSKRRYVIVLCDEMAYVSCDDSISSHEMVHLCDDSRSSHEMITKSSHTEHISSSLGMISYHLKRR